MLRGRTERRTKMLGFERMLCFVLAGDNCKERSMLLPESISAFPEL